MSTSSSPGSILGIVAQMTGATTGVAGSAGSVPAPAAGKHTAFLRGDATFAGASTVSTGSPETLVTGSVGDIYFDSAAGAAYIKTSGTNTNTGWIIQISSPTLIGRILKTSGTTYTPTTGTTKIVAYVIGGGGGGGGATSTANSISAGGGGASGIVGFVEPVSSSTTYTYAIGAAGAGGVGSGAATAGGSSTITVNGNTYTSSGGALGPTAINNSAPQVSGGGNGGSTTPSSATGNTFYVSNGGGGGWGMTPGTNTHGTGAGGSNMFGVGGKGQIVSGAGHINGAAADGFGGGGSGAAQNDTTNSTGGAGTAGAIIIFEYR